MVPPGGKKGSKYPSPSYHLQSLQLKREGEITEAIYQHAMTRNHLIRRERETSHWGVTDPLYILREERVTHRAAEGKPHPWAIINLFESLSEL